MKTVHRILYVRTDRLGETLLTLPAMAAAKAIWPGSVLMALVHPELVPLLRSVPWIDEIMADEPKPDESWWLRSWRLSRTLRSRRFDLAVIANPRKEWHLAVSLSGIPQRVGYARKWGLLLTHRIKDRKALGERHEVEYNLDLLRALGVAVPPVPMPPWRFDDLDRDQAEAFRFIEQMDLRPSEPFIVVHPWASNPLKEWPTDRFQSVIRLTVERLSRQVIVIGGQREQRRSQVMVFPGLPVGNLTGRLTLRQLAGLLQRAQVLISNDSGPVHLAAALGIKTIVLFGTTDPGTSPRRWGPWGSGHAVIWKPSMEMIAVEDVLLALQSQMT